MMGIEEALDWLKKKGKSPLETDSGLWRWTLPEFRDDDRRPDELPVEVFDRLKRAKIYVDPPPGRGPGPFPWLYETPVHAQLAAVLAILYADMDGVL